MLRRCHTAFIAAILFSILSSFLLDYAFDIVIAVFHYYVAIAAALMRYAIFTPLLMLLIAVIATLMLSRLLPPRFFV